MMRALILALGLAANGAAAQDRPVVAAVNYPLAWAADRLGGDAVDVLFPVPADTDPAFWRPGLSDIAAIQQADVIALNGADYAAWTARSALPRSRVVVTADDFSDAFIATETVTHSHGGDGEHSHAGTASITWLDFAQAAVQADALAQAMARRVPALRDGIEARGADLRADLMALDSAARDAFAPYAGQAVLATHPRYHYLARAYGPDIVAMEWEAGAMPDDAQWQALAARAGDTGASLLLWEAAPPDAALDRAAELGLTSVVFAPLSRAPAQGDFLSVMTAQIAAVAASAE